MKIHNICVLYVYVYLPGSVIKCKYKEASNVQVNNLADIMTICVLVGLIFSYHTPLKQL